MGTTWPLSPMPASLLVHLIQSSLASTSIFMAGTGAGQEGRHVGEGGLPLPVQPWGVPGTAGEGGIKSRRENILQQVQLATGLNGCQPAQKSQTHLCSSVGHQMGPGLVFWAGVSLGGLGKSLWGGLAAPARDAYTLPAFPRILSLVFLACFASRRPDPSQGVGEIGATPKTTAIPARHNSCPSPNSAPRFSPQIPQ